MIHRFLSLPLLVAGLALIPASSAVAQPTTLDDAKALLREASGVTKQAKTLEEFSEIIALCEEAEKVELSESLQNYVSELLAWAHNRRGELYAEQAAQMAEQDQQEAAKNLDAEALKEFETAFERNSDYWKAIHNLGVSRAVSGDFDQAIKDFARVIELNPDYANAWFNRGEILFEQGEYRSALTDYTEAARLDPKDLAVRLRRAHTHFELRQYREALSDFDRAVQLDGQNAEARLSRGDAYRRMGQWGQAAEDYREAITLDKDYARAYQAAAWLMATCPDQRYRDKDLAVRAAQKACELEGPGEYRSLDALAAAQASAGAFPAAQKTIAQAIQAAPTAEQAALKARQALYAKDQPYRDKAESTVN